MLTKIQSRLTWSVAFLSVVLLTALVSKPEEQPSPIYGAPSEYSLTLNATNSPTLSTNYVDFVKTIRYSEFQFFSAKASFGDFIALDVGGGFRNTETSQITSVTSITAVYESNSALMFWVGKTPEDIGYMNSLTSGVRYNVPNLPYFLDFWTTDYPMVIESLVITYTCVPS